MKRALLIVLAVCLAAAAGLGQSIDDLTLKATAAYQQKHYREAAGLFAKALEAGADDPGVAYNGACSWALAGDRDKAFESLNKAAELGYADAEAARNDKDFESLHGDPRWTAALARFTRAAEERVLMWDSPAIATAPAEELSDDLKIAGLSKLWAEARYNFAFPRKLVEIDWDGLYLRSIPKVREARTVYDYYRVLQAFCAQLKDGHSVVSFPGDIYAKVIGRVGLRTRLVEARVMVVEVWDPELRAQGITPGMEIIRINGLPARRYAEEFVAPYQSASTPQDLDVRVYDYGLFAGPVSETIDLAFQSADGRITERTIRRKLADERKVFMPKREPFQFRRLDGNIAYVVLNTFNDDAAADGFLKAFDEIAASQALVIDIRDNGGGNSGVGYRVLAALVDKPFLDSRWATRDYKPAFRAWGQADRMYSPAVESVPPDPAHHYGGPVVVLSSSRTYSAAEDFLVAFDTAGRGMIIGEPSGGSTGQPLSFKLPAGGSARICSKRDTYADGKAFVGVGVQPQIVIRSTVADLRAGQDRVLDAALSEVRRQLSRQ